MIEFLTKNWAVIIALICIISVTSITVYQFIGLPTSKQKEKVLEWLLYAVTEAEKIFGSQTGAIKLRYVYDRFIEKFPAISRVISFETFSCWVDKSLEEMKHLVSTNKAVENYIKEV